MKNFTFYDGIPIHYVQIHVHYDMQPPAIEIKRASQDLSNKNGQVEKFENKYSSINSTIYFIFTNRFFIFLLTGLEHFETLANTVVSSHFAKLCKKFYHSLANV